MNIQFRSATTTDLPAIVEMLSDDPLGAERERFADPLPDSYTTAFESIEKDPNNELIVVEHENTVVGVVQVTFLPNLSYQGSWRALIEGVRVHKKYRAKDIGHSMIRHAIEVAKSRGCMIVQLTADKTRRDAIRFYEGLGFRASHEGLKLWL